MIANLSHQPAASLSTRMTGWFSWSRNRQYVEWTLSKLNVQPYQHILEVFASPAFSKAGANWSCSFNSGPVKMPV